MSAQPQPTAVTPPPSRSRPTPGGGSIQSLPEAWIDTLFSRFLAIWPSAWADIAHNADMATLKSEWAQGLAGLQGNEIRDGLAYCRKHQPWPPAISEFRAACRRHETPEQRAFRARSTTPPAALPKETWAETKVRGAAYARQARLIANGERDEPRRTNQAVRDGTWTKEHEARFQGHCRTLGMVVADPFRTADG